MRSWKEKELDGRLRDEFKKRGFFQLGIMPPELAPLPYGFKKRDNAIKLLRIMEDEYRCVAFKNMVICTGFETNTQEVGANVFIKLGSLSREPYPVIEITTFYDNRIYKYALSCEPFNRVMLRDDIQRAIDVLMDFTDDAIKRWLMSVRTLIVENHWPEEEYIRDAHFMDDLKTNTNNLWK